MDSYKEVSQHWQFIWYLKLPFWRSQNLQSWPLYPWVEYWQVWDLDEEIHSKRHAWSPLKILLKLEVLHLLVISLSFWVDFQDLLHCRTQWWYSNYWLYWRCHSISLCWYGLVFWVLRFILPTFFFPVFLGWLWCRWLW